MIAVLDPMASVILRSFYANNLYAPSIPYSRFQDTQKAASLTAVTGDAMTVWQFFEDMPLDTTINTSSDIGPEVPPVELLRDLAFGPVTYELPTQYHGKEPNKAKPGLHVGYVV